MARVPGAEAVYQVADLFRERCLEEGRSLLWPDEHLWTEENLNLFWEECFISTRKGGTKEGQYWDELIKKQPVEIRKIGSDATVFIRIYDDTTKRSNKVGRARKTYPWDDSDAPETETWQLVQEAFAVGIGDPTLSLRFGGQQTAIEYPVRLAIGLRIANADVTSYPAMSAVADGIMSELDGHAPLFRNITLHLLFPELIERIASNQHRRRIFDAFSSEAGSNETLNVDEGLLKIREHLMSKRNMEPFDFYDPDIKVLWDPPKPPKDTKLATVQLNDDTEEAPQSDQQPVDAFELLVTAVHHSDIFLLEINDLLLDKRQLIFEGPPGSGKTFVADKFARWFTDQPLNGEELNEQVEIVQFHQSYGYEDFVQGIRPETNDDGQLVYVVRPGIFLEMCKRAIANPEKPFVLIIDEINRGNLSRIFGELLLLLEYRDKSVRLPYGSGDSSHLKIPKNLYLIGTMNTADRSLAQIDYALRRRFYFVRFMPVVDGRAEVFESWLATQAIDHAAQSRLIRLFITLNHGIREHLKTDDLQIGHSYFMKDDIATEAGFNRVWTRAVEPLLNEYLHHHHDRDEILAALTPASLTRETVDAAVEGEEIMDEMPDESGQDQ